MCFLAIGDCIISALTFSAHNREIIVIVIVITPHYHDLQVSAILLSSTPCDKSNRNRLLGLTVTLYNWWLTTTSSTLIGRAVAALPVFNPLDVCVDDGF
jgi:hypothetical protein